jgi:ubiquinone/menaquinone biosynthesis C-methylase UbiE
MARKGILEDAGCPWWICWTFDNPFRRLIHNPARMLSDLVREGSTALDVGCGEGYFTIELARLVGPAGRVIAVDIQEHMLKVARRRARRAGVSERVTTILGSPDRLTCGESIDFALAFWMAHEVPDRAGFFKDIAACLKPGGKFLLVEPKWHVSLDSFKEMAVFAANAGLKFQENRQAALSRAILFLKSEG